MAKYSTGDSSGGGDGDTCELCGAASKRLRLANVAGAELSVCPDCAPHDDAQRTTSSRSESGGSSGRSEGERKRNTARTSNWDGDTSHWEEEGTNYDDDPLPYLVPDYGDRLTERRQEVGLQREELAAELDVDEADVIAIEQGRATRAGIGGGLIAAIEEHLDVELAES
ncbi:helix-turn-helix domain-containing protein [Haloarchaeobius sp. HRN-SO-5]|uniref:helix-turn-helix domain-containing protein n=1 Tax=Haloarchaeobius sp. HRN-SO-5 TaxID=3446118 RepID=UPI003EB8C5CE